MPSEESDIETEYFVSSEDRARQQETKTKPSTQNLYFQSIKEPKDTLMSVDKVTFRNHDVGFPVDTTRSFLCFSQSYL